MKTVVKCITCGKPTLNSTYCSQHCRTHKATKETLLENLNTRTITATADLLGISIQTLYKLMDRYKIKKVYVG